MRRGQSVLMTAGLVAAGLFAAGVSAGLSSGDVALAEPADPSYRAVRCAEDLSPVEQASQVLLALTSDPTDVAEQIRLGRVTGIAPVGDFVDRLGAQFGRPWVELSEAHAQMNPPGIYASDEEGGVVQRFRAISDPVPSARLQATLLTSTEVLAGFEAYGNRLRDIGVTMAFAPVVDVGGGPAIGDRSYGDDPAVVIEYAGAVVDGYLRAGITPVIKHFPGHGRASADSHDGPAVTPPLDELRALDLVPFESLFETHGNDVAVMIGHLDVPGLTDGMPASLSHSAITGLLRDEMGFDGLVVSDALGMGAIRQIASPEDAIVMFLRAGGDLALVDWADLDASRSAVFDAVTFGQLEPLRLHQAVNQVLDVKGVQRNCARPWDLSAAAVVRGAIAPPT